MIGYFDKKAFAKLLNLALGKRSINQYERDSGVSAAHISRLMRELVDAPPSPQTIEKLSVKAHNRISYDDFMKAAGHLSLEPIKELNSVPQGTSKLKESDRDDLEKSITLTKMVEIPVYSMNVIEGEEIFAESNIIGWQHVPVEKMNYICFKIPDDSMSSSGIYKDYVVTVKKQNTALDGNLVVVRLNNGSVLIRRVRYFNDEVLLDPENPGYLTIRVKADDIEIIGVVTDVTFKVI
ncbi:MAG: hypothetical protein GXY50_02495 [Syntrophomonadaceae bacterium]|nr:hypothetical protein [Syntrophomonadaceae bacterium]